LKACGLGDQALNFGSSDFPASEERNWVPPTSSTGSSQKREIPTSSTIKHYQLDFELDPDGLDSCSAQSDLRDTTIDKQFRSGNVAAVVSREKYRDLSDLIGCAEPA
jgi:hypothetical protein